jgi:hypothetical protein
MSANKWAILRLWIAMFEQRKSAGHEHHSSAIPFSGRRIAARLRITEDAAKKALRALRNDGLLRKVDQLPSTKGERDGAALYALVVEVPCPLVPSNVEAASVVHRFDPHGAASGRDREVAVQPVAEEHHVAGVPLAELTGLGRPPLTAAQRRTLDRLLRHGDSLYAPFPTQPMDGLGAALTYAESGKSVLPLRPGSKEPYRGGTSRGVKNATTDQSKLKRWWSIAPDANVAIRTGVASALVVLDVDGDDGMRSLVKLEEANSPLPLTARVRTPRGGFHFYFQHPGVPIPNLVGVAPSIDVRGENGYVAAPPSVRDDGEPYVWVDADASIEPMPDWLIDLLLNHTNKHTGGN